MKPTAALVVLLVPLGIGCASPAKLGDPLDDVSKNERAEFDKGRAVFTREFEPGTGLGPLFNANACSECHEEPVTGGHGDEIETHFALVRPDRTCDVLEDRGGPVVQNHVTPALKEALGIDAEPIPEGVATGRRTTPDIFGFGLLEAVPDKRILAHADPDDRDRDGISGRANILPDGRVGRFGRKAQVADLAEFTRDAFLFEQGITSPGHLAEDTVGGRPLPPGVDTVAEPEIDDKAIEETTLFMRLLAPPAPLELGGQAKKGRKIFEHIGCADCHTPVLKTGHSRIEALEHRKVAAYTDLLLHDMGPDLADICMGLAAPSEFRTEPLMGLHNMTQFLHDGRARSVEEAIRLHGGEASHSRDAFAQLDDKSRAALLAFLGCL